MKSHFKMRNKWRALITKKKQRLLQLTPNSNPNSMAIVMVITSKLGQAFAYYNWKMKLMRRWWNAVWVVASYQSKWLITILVEYVGICLIDKESEMYKKKSICRIALFRLMKILNGLIVSYNCSAAFNKRRKKNLSYTLSNDWNMQMQTLPEHVKWHIAAITCYYSMTCIMFVN